MLSIASETQRSENFVKLIFRSMNEQHYENMTRKQLSQLPERDWKEVSEYDAILVFGN